MGPRRARSENWFTERAKERQESAEQGGKRRLPTFTGSRLPITVKWTGHPSLRPGWTGSLPLGQYAKMDIHVVTYQPVTCPGQFCTITVNRTSGREEVSRFSKENTTRGNRQVKVNRDGPGADQGNHNNQRPKRTAEFPALPHSSTLTRSTQTSQQVTRVRHTWVALSE